MMFLFYIFYFLATCCGYVQITCCCFLVVVCLFVFIYRCACVDKNFVE